MYPWISENSGLAHSEEWSWDESNQEKTSPELLNFALKHGVITSLQTIHTRSVSVLHFSCQIFSLTLPRAHMFYSFITFTSSVWLLYKLTP